MAEGRCFLSSYITGDSPNMCGVFSPASAVSWKESNGTLESRLNNIVIDRYLQDEHAGYPTLCKGRFEVEGKLKHALEELTSLNTLNILPELHKIGIRPVAQSLSLRTSTNNTPLSCSDFAFGASTVIASLTFSGDIFSQHNYYLQMKIYGNFLKLNTFTILNPLSKSQVR